MRKKILKGLNLEKKEVKKMKKIVFATLLCMILSIGTAAQAFWVGTVNDGLGGSVSNVMGFDWSSSGSGNAQGLGPPGTPFPPNTPFDFRYQAELVGLTDPAGNPIVFPGLTNTFEYTAVALVPETGSIIPVVGGLFLGLFFTQPGGTFYLYNDTSPNSNVATGFGFDDGTLVAQGTINTGQISSFLYNSNTGEGIGSAILEGLVTYANPDFLDVASIIFDFRFEGTLNYPPLDSTTVAFFPGRAGEGNYPVYNVAGNDIPLKVDGSSKFSVPEPSTIILLGVGLLGLRGIARRRIKK